MATLSLSLFLVNSHAHARPALPAPEMMTSASAKSCKSFMYLSDISLLTVDSRIGLKILPESVTGFALKPRVATRTAVERAGAERTARIMVECCEFLFFVLWIEAFELQFVHRHHRVVRDSAEFNGCHFWVCADIGSKLGHQQSSRRRFPPYCTSSVPPQTSHTTTCTVGSYGYFLKLYTTTCSTVPI